VSGTGRRVHFPCYFFKERLQTEISGSQKLLTDSCNTSAFYAIVTAIYATIDILNHNSRCDEKQFFKVAADVCNRVQQNQQILIKANSRQRSPRPRSSHCQGT